MTNLRILLCTLILSLTLGSIARTAAADPAQTKAILKEALDIEQSRVKELEGMAKNDDKLAAEIDKYVKVRLKFATEAEARATKLRESAAGNWPHNTNADAAHAAIEKFAATMETFAKNDREQAEKRKEAEDILIAQAKGAAEGVANHRANIAELKAKLELLK